MVGMSVLNRDFYGVYPLRGKLLNVKKASKAKISKNKVIMDIMEILGLKKQYRKYRSTKGLRYGRLMIMTDQVRLFTLQCIHYSIHVSLQHNIYVTDDSLLFRITMVPI